MKNVLLALVAVVCVFKALDYFAGTPNIEPLFDEQYVAVYGRNSCGWTQKTLKRLDEMGMNYKYYVVDDNAVANTLHSRMETAGLSTKRYNLPVVDVNGKMFIRPNSDEIYESY